MNKAERHALIRKIIETETIGTQAELADAVRREGFNVTQATVCRDIKEMQLYKALSKNGKYQYAIMPAEEGQNTQGRFIRMLKDGIVSIAHVRNQIVIRTLPASAHVVGEVIDTLAWPEILGTIAGDNTILLIAASDESVYEVLERIRVMTGITEETQEEDEM